jgi:flotillin
VAEATRASEAEQTEASAHQAAQVARIQAELKIAEENNRLRVRKAELDAEARARESEAEVSGEKARVKAQQDLQAERIGLEQKRVEADVVIPAQADKQASELRAKGVAASILENGNANLAVLDRMIQLYGRAGSDAERIFVLNMLPGLIKELAGSVEHIKIDKMSVIDSGRAGTGVASAAAQFPEAIIKLTEQIETATGVNILSRLQRGTDSLPRGDRK